MDKLKIALEVWKKHHFWVLLGLVLVLGLSIFVVAAAGLKSEYKKAEQAIEGPYKQTKEIVTVPDHPNDGSIASLAERTKQQEQKVNEAWLELYREQKKANPWPGVLGAEFLKFIQQAKPGDEIGPNYREVYRDRIEEALPKLFEIVNYKHYIPREAGEDEPALDDGMGMAPGQQRGMKPVGIVEWDDLDRKRIEKEFDWPTVPSSERVRLAQEDVWVYKALLTIIKDTNGAAETQSSAAIKRIIALEIGKTAAQSIASKPGPSLVKGTTPTAGAAGGMGMGMEMGAMEMGGGLGLGADLITSTEPTAGTAQSVEEFLLNQRYVKDEKMAPMTAAEAQTQKQFKRMPVRMELVIDQRKIPNLLVECANSKMPVEVVRFRINPQDSGSAGGMGMGGMEMGGMGMEGGMGMGGPMEGGMVLGGAEMGGGRGMGGMTLGGMEMGGSMDIGGGASQKQDPNPYEVTIEIRGIIYIYQPSPLEAAREWVEQATEKPDARPADPAATDDGKPAPPPADGAPTPAAGAALPAEPQPVAPPTP